MKLKSLRKILSQRLGDVFILFNSNSKKSMKKLFAIASIIVLFSFSQQQAIPINVENIKRVLVKGKWSLVPAEKDTVVAYVDIWISKKFQTRFEVFKLGDELEVYPEYNSGILISDDPDHYPILRFFVNCGDCRFNTDYQIESVTEKEIKLKMDHPESNVGNPYLTCSLLKRK